MWKEQRPRREGRHSVQAGALGRLLQGDHVLFSGPIVIRLQGMLKALYQPGPLGVTMEPGLLLLSSSRSPSLPPSHCHFIFRASGSSPKPVTFTH